MSLMLITKIGIRWFEIMFRSGPIPIDWREPDWNNMKRFRLERKTRIMELPLLQ
jgi:hypothetical protein